MLVNQQSGVPGRDSNPIPSLPHANNLATPQILRPDSCGCAYQCCPVSIFMCLYADLYIPRIGPHISYSRIDRCIVGIYKSLKLGLWPCNSFSGNICFQFLVLVLCSAGTKVFKPILAGEHHQAAREGARHPAEQGQGVQALRRHSGNSFKPRAKY